MTWEPILEGELADRSWRAVRGIARDLARATAQPADLAMFWSYATAGLGSEFEIHQEAAMARFTQYLEAGIPHFRLYGGLAGAGWIVAHCFDGSDEFLDVVDSSLIATLRGRAKWTTDYDLIGGLTGMAVYFLEREAPAAQTGLDLIVEHFAKLAEHTPAGITWHTPPDLLPPHQREMYPMGYYNCGIAHGVPGAIAVLGKLAGRSSVAAELRDGAMRWMTAQHGFDPHHSRFPSLIVKDGRSTARTAWCYGDPGVVVALWDATARAGRSTAEIEELALAAMNRSLELSGSSDAMLCHGTAGLAHMCNRFYQATRDPRFRDVARRWFAHTLDFQHEGEGIGGFLAWKHNYALEVQEWQAAPDFLDGASGLALALLSALQPLEPNWDRLMLCDLPVRS